MPVVDAILAKNTKLHYSTDGGTIYLELTDLKEIGSPGDPEAPEVDVTPLTPNGDTREFLLGLNKAGSMMFKQYYNKTRFAALRGLLLAKNDWKYTFPDGVAAAASILTFKGLLKKCTISPASDPDVPDTIDCEVLITGPLTFTPGT